MALKIRDPEEVRTRMANWLGEQLGPESQPEVGPIDIPEESGFSSETLLFDATWTDETGKRSTHALVTRFPPGEVLPVFPHYDLGAQARCMQLVAEHTDVPVPTCRWLEEDDAHLGSSFLIMDRIDGRVPPDRMPYTFGSWLTDATEAERAQLEKSSVEVLAGIHTITPDRADLSFLEVDADGDTPLRRHVNDQYAYYEWARAGVRYSLVEDMLAWLEDHWPESESSPVLGWGDARPGNILYAGFTPAGVLDWEMATVAPPEMDLGWMIFLHSFFQNLTEVMELPGLPGYFDRNRVCAIYEAAAGHSPRDIEWFEAYCALRHGIIMTRTSLVEEAEGRAEPPDDPNDRILHRVQLEAMLDGTYFT